MLTLIPNADALDCIGVLHLAEQAVLAGMLTVSLYSTTDYARLTFLVQAITVGLMAGSTGLYAFTQGQSGQQK